MYRQFVILIAITIWSATTLPLPKQANAETALTRAVVQSLRNLVQLMPQKSAARLARVADAIAPGDALSTGRSSLAELRFNDGSLARIGEQAVFRFVTQTRNFKLSNGTVLLLIPPGQGTTGVWTPNAAAAIRGSALFMRYIPETATTVVGALTNSNIEVFNQQSSRRQVLQAGQLLVIVKDKIEGLYNFDLKTFYETSDLVQGLDLNKKSGVTSLDPAIALVQAETAAALAAQLPLNGAEVIVNPAFIRRSDNSQTQAQPALTLQENSQNPFNSNSNPITEFLENGEISHRENLQNLPSNNGIDNGVGGGSNNPGIGNAIGNGNNGIAGAAGGGAINNPGIGSGGINNPGIGNNNDNNGIGGGIGGGGINNPGTGNGNGNGNGGANNPGTGIDRGNNGNNGIGGGIGGGGINNPGTGNGNGNGNGGANNPGTGIDRGNNGNNGSPDSGNNNRR